MIVGDVTNDVKTTMLAVSVYVCLPLCENVLSTSLHIAIQKKLFIIRPPSRCFVLGSTFAFRFIGHFYCSQNITAHQEQKRKPTTVVLFFYIQCF